MGALEGKHSSQVLIFLVVLVITAVAAMLGALQ
jgi:hypothetical protein